MCFPPYSLQEPDGMLWLRLEHTKYPFLRVGKSSLGSAAGLGLFAKRDIDVSSRGGVLCVFWGKLALCTEDDIASHDDPSFLAVKKNLIVFPNLYNPVIAPPPPMDGAPREHLYLIGSNCCMASYANTAAPNECNAVIQDITPIEWNYKEGYTDYNHFMAIIKKPILCLKLIR
jgi:hypothetical protein